MAAPNPNGRIEAGQPIAQAFSARAWNRAQDAADAILGGGRAFGADGVSAGATPYSWLYLENRSQDLLERGMPVALFKLAAGPQPVPVLMGRKPSAVSTERTFEAYGIALEPIAQFQYGRVAVSGVVQAKVVIDPPQGGAPRDRFRPASGNYEAMRAHQFGSFELIAAEEGYGEKWAVVRFNAKPQMLHYFTLSANVQKGHSVTFTMPDGEAIYAVCPFASIPSGRKAMAGLADDGVWYIIAAECS